MTKKIILFSMLILLTGCNDKKDIKEIIEESKNLRSNTTIEEINIDNFRRIEYIMHNNRNIFLAKSNFVDTNTNYDLSVQPDIFRTKELLENFDIDQLNFMGSFYFIDNEVTLIIQDPTGKTHLIRENNYIGKNHGKILEINDNSIKIEEILPHGEGWNLRVRYINYNKGK